MKIVGKKKIIDKATKKITKIEISNVFICAKVNCLAFIFNISY